MIEWLTEISRYSAFPGVVFFFFIKKKEETARILFFIMLASFIADVGNFFYIKNIKANGYLIGNIWYIVNYILVSFLFFRVFQERKRLVKILFLLFIIGSLISLFFYSLFESNTFIRTYSNVAFIILSLSGYINMLEKPSGALSKSPVFWLLNGVFIYGCITLLKNLFVQYLVFDLNVNKEVFSAIAIINLLANIAKNLIFLYCLILINKGNSGYLKTAKSL